MIFYLRVRTRAEYMQHLVYPGMSDEPMATFSGFGLQQRSVDNVSAVYHPCGTQALSVGTWAGESRGMSRVAVSVVMHYYSGDERFMAVDHVWQSEA